MTSIIDVNSMGYSGSVAATQSARPEFEQAGFAAYLEDAENSAASGQSAAVSAAVQPALTGLLSSNSVPKTVEAAEPDVDEEQSASGQTAREKFQEYMEMTPEERFFVAMLEKKGYTKEEYEALPAEEQQKIQKEIAEDTRQRTEQKVEVGAVGEPTVQETAAQTMAPAGVTSSYTAAQQSERDKVMDWL